jgi:hypothetical protein
MRIPLSRSHQALQTVVRRRSVVKKIERPDVDSGGRFGEHAETTSTVDGVSMWLFNPTEVNVDTEYGDRLSGDLEGLAMPSADVSVDDRITHGADVYEVDRIFAIPDEDRTALKRFSLQRRTNDDSSV